MITLEITNTDIKLMEVINGKVTKWASSPLEAGVFQEEVVLNPQALAAAVKQLMSSNGITEKKVIASVGSLYSLSRVVTVTIPLGQSVTEKAVLEVAEEVMPLSAEELYLAWQTITSGPGGQQVLVIGVPKDVIDSEVRALKAAGINPHILGLRTLALARAVNREKALVLNINTTSFDVIIVADGVAEVLRTSAWQPLDISLEEMAEQLVSALNLTVSFHNSHQSGSPLDPKTPLFITGQMSGDLALIGNIQADIEYPIEPMKPSLEYPEDLPVSQYAVNFGLALKATAAPGIPILFTRKNRAASGNTRNMIYSMPDINLLPSIYHAWQPSAKQIYASLATLVALSLLFPVYGATTAAMKETSLVRQRYAAVNSVMQRRVAELAKREPLEKSVKQFDSIMAMGGDFIDDLEAIRNLAENWNVTISAISQTSSGISFSAEAPDYTVFRDFIKALGDNGQFTTPVIPPEGYPYFRGGSISLTPREGR